MAREIRSDRIVTPVFLRLWLGGLTFFLSFFLLLPTLPMYARAVGVPEASVGLVVGAFPISAMLLRPVVGWAADRIGRRPFLLAGAAVFATAPGLYVIGGSLGGLIGARLYHGLGMGLYQTGSSAAVADIAAPQRRGEALGLFGMSGNVALAIGPLLGIWIADHLGFGWLFAVSTGVALVALLLAVGQQETIQARSDAPLRLGSALSPAVFYPCLIELATMGTYGFVSTYLPLYARTAGGNPGLFFLVMAVAVLLARGVAGRVSDRVGRPPVATAGALFIAAALAAVAVLPASWAIALAGALYGLGFGTTQPAVMAWCVDRVPPGERGKAMGTFFTALELGIAAGAIAFGWIVAATGYRLAFLAGALLALAAAALAALHRHRPPR
jgi:MFS family permease